LVGLDGNIYLQTLKTSQDELGMLGVIGGSSLQDNAIHIIKFNPNTGERKLIQLPLETIQTNFLTDISYGLGSVSELIAVDGSGNLYYWNEPTALFSQEIPLLTIFDADGRVLTQAINTFSANDLYLYQSINSDLVFLDRTSSSILTSINTKLLLPEILFAESDASTTVTESGATAPTLSRLGHSRRRMWWSISRGMLKFW
jgi:hypothetical protein